MTCVPSNFTTTFPMNAIYFTASVVPGSIAVVGNALVVFVICKKKQLQTSTNVLLGGLAVNDFIGAISGQIAYASILSFGKLLGDCLVYNILMAFMFSQYMTSQLIVALVTQVRYKIFLGGLQRVQMSNDNIKLRLAMLCVAWIIGYLSCVPVFVKSLFLYRYVPFLLTTLITGSYIGFRYFTIMKSLKKREKEYKESAASDRQLALRFIKTQKQCLRTIIIVLVILLSPLFIAICTVFFTYYMEKTGQKTLQVHYYTWAWVIWFYYLGGSINPFIYAARQKDLGKAILDIFSYLMCGKSCNRFHFWCCKGKISVVEGNVTTMSEYTQETQ